MGHHEYLLQQVQADEDEKQRQNELWAMRQEIKGFTEFNDFTPSQELSEFTQGRLFVRLNPDMKFTKDRVDMIKEYGADFISSVRVIYDNIVLFSFKKKYNKERLRDVIEYAFLPF